MCVCLPGERGIKSAACIYTMKTVSCGCDEDNDAKNSIAPQENQPKMLYVLLNAVQYPYNCYSKMPFFT